MLLHLLLITAVHLYFLKRILFNCGIPCCTSFAATVLLVAMAATKLSGLLTKATVILKKPSNWQE
jgi:hypothetical protein